MLGHPSKEDPHRIPRFGDGHFVAWLWVNCSLPQGERIGGLFWPGRRPLHPSVLQSVRFPELRCDEKYACKPKLNSQIHHTIVALGLIPSHISHSVYTWTPDNTTKAQLLGSFSPSFNPRHVWAAAIEGNGSPALPHGPIGLSAQACIVGPNRLVRNVTADAKKGNGRFLSWTLLM